MSKKKGLSLEEKRSRMLELFYEKKDFFQLKDIEKLAPKEKGIIVQSVKDVLQSLVDDGLVDSDKIGTSIYYWAFPSKAKHTRKRKIEELEDKVTSVKCKLQKTKETFESKKDVVVESEERDKALQENKDLREENSRLKKELQKYKDSDPEALEKLKKEYEKARADANRWIDNLDSLKYWCKKKFNIAESVLEKQFDIPSDLEYL